MRSFVLSLAVLLAFAGGAAAQTTNPVGTDLPKVLRDKGAESKTQKKTTAKSLHKTAAAAQSIPSTTPSKRVATQRSKATSQHVTPQALRGSRYGGFAPAPPPEPPTLDTTSPRTLNLVNANTNESLSVTYWSNGAYHRDALDQLNHFLRDSRDGAQTEMDPLLFDVLWHTMSIVGYSGTVEVLSGYRSPESNAWLASVSRGVASDSQHINGNAMDIRMPGVPVFRLQQAARSLNMGGVGFYPRSGFVHIDTGPVRYW
jgi:uncharacterized protein YcbK (DUF882 family)